MDKLRGAVSMSGSSGAGYAQLAQKLNQQGIEAQGVINAVRPGGEQFGGGQECQVDVTITPAGGQPYQTTVTQSILKDQVPKLQPGGAVTVKYDPENPSAALLYSW
jgi:hypothetical protein